MILTQFSFDECKRIVTCNLFNCVVSTIHFVERCLLTLLYHHQIGIDADERVGRYSFIGIDPYLVMIQQGEKATLHKMDRGHNTVEEIACHDPLAFIEAELGQYHLVTLSG